MLSCAYLHACAGMFNATSRSSLLNDDLSHQDVSSDVRCAHSQLAMLSAWVSGSLTYQGLLVVLSTLHLCHWIRRYRPPHPTLDDTKGQAFLGPHGCRTPVPREIPRYHDENDWLAGLNVQKPRNEATIWRCGLRPNFFPLQATREATGTFIVFINTSKL